LISELERQDENKEVYIFCTYDGGYLCGGNQVKVKQWKEIAGENELTAQTNAIILYNDRC